MRQKMHWCTCKLNLAGQGFTHIWFDATNPVSWPEAQVLMLIHGQENVYDIKPISIVEADVASEKERLMIKYSYKPVEHSFPGRLPRMETLMPASEELALPPGDQYGIPMGVAAIVAADPPNPKPDDEDEDNGDDPAIDPLKEMPPTTAVFKAGKHQPPRKGA